MLDRITKQPFCQTRVTSSAFFGGRMSSNHQRLLEKIGLDITRHKLYSWKHTGAIALARASVPMKQIQIHLRHHSLEITDRYLRDMAINETDEIVKNYPPI